MLLYDKIRFYITSSLRWISPLSYHVDILLPVEMIKCASSFSDKTITISNCYNHGNMTAIGVSKFVAGIGYCISAYITTYTLHSNTTLTFNLAPDTEFALLISKPYTWKLIKQSGSGTLVGSKYAFNSGSAGEVNEHTFRISNGKPVNNFLIV